jgi:hypothetical protein
MIGSLFRKVGLSGPMPCSGLLLALGVAALVGSASPAWGGGKPTPGRTPQLRELHEFPEDYLGQTFTYTVRISTAPGWMRRNGEYFFLFVQDAQGNKLPNRGFSPDATINLIRFVLPRAGGKKLLERLNAGQMYEARIRFTIARQRALVGQSWQYLAMISSVEER